jgi:PelA/Pel-15E family pectate lyase
MVRSSSIRLTLLLLTSLAFTPVVSAQDDALRGQASAAMRKAAEYYHGEIAVHGGYVYYYSLDLQRRLGEGVATAEQIWVQPPGTPTVGLAYLRAYEATGDKFYLDAATDTAEALIYGQLQSGGWTNSIDFNPQGAVALYRNGKGKGRNYSTLDDGISQGAIRLLMHADRAHEFKHEPIHEAAHYALDALLAAQFPNGAFPQVWTGPVAAQPIVKASFPDYDWRTENRIKEYWNMYTLNDGLAGTVLATLADAHAIYKDGKYVQAIKRLGDFLILAQLPEPQPAWSQQYDYQMRPIWARKFEPAAVTGGESQDVLETLIEIHRLTGDKKYLEPIPRAIAYLKQSLLSDGRLARYYELETNKPLYMFRRGDVYSLTYDDSNLPSHYGWKIASRLDAFEREYAAAAKGETTAKAASADDLEEQARDLASSLDEQGRWITTYRDQPLVGQPKFRPGDQYLGSADFSRNLETLSEYLKSTR